MDDFKDYARSLTVFFMGIGFALAFLGFYVTETIFYIAIGWEASTILIMILMQESIHEWFLLKKKTRFARKEQKKWIASGSDAHGVVRKDTSVTKKQRTLKSDQIELEQNPTEKIIK